MELKFNYYTFNIIWMKCVYQINVALIKCTVWQYCLSPPWMEHWPWSHYSELQQTCIPGLLPFCHYHVLYQGAPHCCLSGTLQRSRCMSGTILPEHGMRMPKRKLHYFFFCSEYVRKKTVGNCEFGITWVVMVVGIHLNARRFSRAETNATAG